MNLDELRWIDLFVGQSINEQNRCFVDKISIQPFSPTYRLRMTPGTILRMLVQPGRRNRSHSANR
jgi:hypothetical protein